MFFAKVIAYLGSLYHKVPVDNPGLDDINQVKDREGSLDGLVLEAVDADVLAAL